MKNKFFKWKSEKTIDKYPILKKENLVHTTIAMDIDLTPASGQTPTTSRILPK